MPAKDTTTRDYRERINRVIFHIEAHLGEPLNLEDLAKVAFLSPYHFHRIIAAFTGEPLAAFIRRLRLVRAALAAGDSLATAARRLGVSPRGLQRRLRAIGLPPPDFWRLLGRARSAANALPGGAPLAAIAADFGYSDQSHMTREFVRWLGIAPDRLRHAPARMDIIRQPGLGNWTGEQISTR
jgi:AraC-like DNA-binding protein